ncbi:glycosyltransferase family 2 protein [Patescibacteria group bacterium]|nr:glycosyltransferase family 2 protein [Patescibacteria group bacterium]
MSLSIIIPVYNEDKTIREVIENVYNNSSNYNDFELIVVDDGSTDKTEEYLKILSEKYDSMVALRLDKNRGKTDAVRSGMEVARGDYLAIQDADLEYNPSELFYLYSLAIDNSYSAVYGSRLLKKNPYKHRLFLWGNIFITRYYNLLFRDNITDISTCYKVFRRDIVEPKMITEKKFGFCAQLTCILNNRGIKIVEFPISYKPRSIKEGKSIRPIDGLKFIWIITKNFLKRSLQK